MSFSVEVKTEILSNIIKKPCCIKAQSYGLMLCSRGFSANNISLQTENELLASYFAMELNNILGKEFFVDTNGFSQMLTVSVSSSADRLAILKYFGCDIEQPKSNINSYLIEKRCCTVSFLRGAFLSGGFLTNPEKYYMLEFVVSYKQLAVQLQQLLLNFGYEGKISNRDNNFVLYFTVSEHIEDILTLIGASNASLEMMNVKIYKDIRNRTNRVTNCETANISRTINASTKQVEAIKKLMSHPSYNALKENLKNIATLRLKYPDYTLQELSIEAGLSKSGINHRLNSLVCLSDELE